MDRLVILAPNWLGDAVMALPAIADVRRAAPEAEITVAARPPIAPLFRLVPGVNDTIVLGARLSNASRAPGSRASRGTTRRFGPFFAGGAGLLGACAHFTHTLLERSVSIVNVAGWQELGVGIGGKGFDTALLLPNSIHAALLAARAGIPNVWGYRTDWRGALLTRAIHRISGLHQVEYYRQLVHALGFPNGPIEPRVLVSGKARDSAARVLMESGWDGRAPLVALAPGAAYGGAKRWPPAYFAALAGALAADGVRCVIVGSAADVSTGAEVTQAFHGDPERVALHSAGLHLAGRAAIIDMTGRTDLQTLTGVLAHCRALVTNDSGAMHLAAAVGISVTAVFGPTDESATRPMGDAHAVVTHPVWCRPCLLRECPIDHRCMRGISVAAVLDVARRTL